MNINAYCICIMHKQNSTQNMKNKNVHIFFNKKILYCPWKEFALKHTITVTCEWIKQFSKKTKEKNKSVETNYIYSFNKLITTKDNICTCSLSHTHTHTHTHTRGTVLINVSENFTHSVPYFSVIQWSAVVMQTVHFFSQLLHWTNCWLAMHAGEILFYKRTIKQNRLFPLSVER